MPTSHGWAEVSRERKREIVEAIANGHATRGPVHAELDITDRCNVACYFCNQQDLRTKEQLSLDCVKRLIDELADGGLKSVRLSGGGDPLFHREILDVFDHLQDRSVVIDNLTTNAVALTEAVAERLVQRKAREVIVSLNAADPADYQRMMRVKPALFDVVVANLKRLVQIRGAASLPTITVQYLLDRENYSRMPEMYELAAAAGADRVAINPVLEIPRERIDERLLLLEEDSEAVRPYLRRLLELDRGANRLQLYFPFVSWNALLTELKRETGHDGSPAFATASSFREENGHCFFGWYSMTVTGTGDVYPCCLLLNPEVKPLANVRDQSAQEVWNGPGFTRMREEMRDVLLRPSTIEYHPDRFQILEPQCVNEGACYLKNMYFRGDEEFYSELGSALQKARRREVRWLGTPKQILRALETFAHENPRFRALHHTLRARTNPLRAWMKRRLGISFFSH
jgi:MoaA/NifB/PqqE/SkfB family radical SAM enzyme